MCFSYPVCRLAGSSFAKTDVSMTDEDIKRSIRLKREELGMTQAELEEAEANPLFNYLPFAPKEVMVGILHDSYRF